MFNVFSSFRALLSRWGLYEDPDTDSTSHFHVQVISFILDIIQIEEAPLMKEN